MFDLRTCQLPRLRHAAAALCLLGLGGAAQAEALRIEGGACGQPWRVQIEDQELAATLQSLADAMGFTLKYLAEDNPQRSGTFSGDATAVLKQLVGSHSLITSGRPDPDCANAYRVARVVILPVGEEGELPPVSDVPPGVQRYRRAHGMDPYTGELLHPKKSN